MNVRLPTIGGDTNAWGPIVHNFLAAGHAGDGVHWDYEARLAHMVRTKWAVPTPPDNTAGLSELSISAIQTPLTAAASGSTVTVADGIYRGTLTWPSTSNITLKAANPGKVSIRGSDVWTAWTFNGGLGGWVSTLTVPTFATDPGGISSDAFTFDNRDQVHIDGVPQTHVASGTLTAGQYKMVNYSSDRRIVLFADPAGKTVEVTTRIPWINSLGTIAGCIIDGIEFRHAASGSNQLYAIDISGSANAVVRRCIFRNVYGTAMSIGQTSLATRNNVLIEENWFYYCGVSGLQAYQANGLRIKRNWFIDTGQDWNGNQNLNMNSGAKIVTCHNSLFEENFVGRSNFSGLWTDIECKYTSFARNVVWDCKFIGIHNEISAFMLVCDNLVLRTPSWPHDESGYKIGIYTSTTRQSITTRNLVVFHKTGYDQGWYATARADEPAGNCNGVWIYDNTFIGRYHASDNSSESHRAMNWSDDAGTFGTQIADAGNTNGGGGNWFSWDGVEASNLWSLQEPDYYRWVGPVAGTQTYFQTLAAYVATRWESGANLPTGLSRRTTRYLTEPERQQILAGLGLL